MTSFSLWINLFCLVLSQSHALETSPLTEAAPFVLFGLRQHISRFELDGSDVRHYLSKDSGLQGVVGVDTDIRNSRIYWSDVATRQLLQGNINRTSITNVHQLLQENASMIEGVAWDWVNHKLYWTTVGNNNVNSTVEVMDTDNCHRKILASYGDGTRARAIVLDPIRGWVFWTDFSSTSSRIVRMSMDGTNATVLVEAGELVQYPNGLSLDYATQTLFWIDAGKDVIGSVGIDGTHRKMIANLSRYYDAPHPFALEFFGGQLYFSDWKVDAIWKLPSINSNVSVVKVQNFSFDPTTIRVVHPARQPGRPGGNPCAVNNGGCKYLCLLSATPSGFSCVTPDSSLPCTAPSPTPTKTPTSPPIGTENISTTQASESDRCRNGGTCTTNSIPCKEDYPGHNCTRRIDGGNFPGNFSVSGTLFLGVVGSLLVVIVIMTAIIAVIVWTSVRSKNGKRSHSIGGLSDTTPRASPTHEVIRKLTDHNYISIKSRESPTPRTIIINIENIGGSPTFEQFSRERTNSSGMNTLILTPNQSCNISNETDLVSNENHSNNNPVKDSRVMTLEDSGDGEVVESDSNRHESLL